ncbi:uncharacterized protein PHACADRAFT_151194 [Phanerochaete carnosa HHB-10118-sp]|uniref:Uncharacterized protein n=1 Tax=Phanerochaete carnosa (strain HHB-10118-sp) TaxID=650164 RepID=K5VZB1_PHACS|nr:uncharacterized protein PHACADRAFT_151194 [Phanerochaete carnosa HHB-10118-sp]EKM52180.1 hypothetical protein PHACADRAFT_151194 [Phanerochaete carnosa HHB-10118-sp]
MNVYAIGASQNVGCYTAVRLLERGATVTFLLRRHTVFEGNDTMQHFIHSGNARLVQGDALKLEDVAHGWAESQAASPVGDVDVVLFSVGGALQIDWLRGGKIHPQNLCSASLLNVLRTLPSALRDPARQPRFIVVSTTGATRSSHDRLPFVMRVFYWWLLTQPHVDKFALERVLAWADGTHWDDDGYHPDILPVDWQHAEGMPEQGSLRRVLVVRPAFLTNGPAKGDTQGQSPLYHICEDDKGSEGYTISRRDVAHFIVEKALADWERKRVSLAY